MKLKIGIQTSVLTIAVCFVVLLMGIVIGLVTQQHVQNQNQAQVIARIQEQAQVQATQFKSFLSQIQQCRDLAEIDFVLRSNGIDRVKGKKRR